MTRGTGSLFVSTRSGVRMLGLSVRAAGAPAPTWWAHHCGCAWMAAYLQLRDRRFLADRELLDDPAWSGRVSWSDGKGHHTAQHRPDLIGFFPDGTAVAMEVELAQKSLARLRAIVTLHAEWTTARRTSGVMYVCGDQDGADRVMRAAKSALGSSWNGVGTWLLDEIREKTTAMGEARRTSRASGGAEQTATRRASLG